ncbi:nucleotide sugar dehydrogenase [Rhodobacteraceae bacterium NNCM2]|nr:nucleotide sugar dehydrogenase [Coraliihabitans acroporae]
MVPRVLRQVTLPEETKELLADPRIAVIGLGYVGLPLAVAFGGRYPVLGFDIDPGRISELSSGIDRTREVARDEIETATHLSFSADPAELKGCNLFLVTVPTPITADKKPDLSLLLQASQTVGEALGHGDVVVFESTVYPGATEDDCVPILEAASGLTFNRDFFAGYSPERINPGDKQHRISSICKVVAGSTPTVTDRLADLYGEIVSAGIHKAESIRIAEAAKVIENTQRDLNIALVNELAIIFAKMGIDTEAVLRAAGTKWNFQPFRPGLVGGHCIGVDPYYLTHKAEAIGYHPEIILAGRRLNDGMGVYAAGQLVQTMLKRRIAVDGARILVMGLAFKENCPDVRNSQVVALIRELEEMGAVVDTYDPHVPPAEAARVHGIDLADTPKGGAYDAIVLAVAHSAFRELSAGEIRAFGKNDHVLYDLKYILPVGDSDLRL